LNITHNMIIPENILLPEQTLFRKNAACEIAKATQSYGSHGLIVHGNSLDAHGKKERILKNFSHPEHIALFCRNGGEPTLEEVSTVIAKAKESKAQWIIGIGGGSVLDLAKAAAGLFNAKESPVVYQKGKRLEKPGIPFIAIPTTAGTGSEATSNSVISNPERKTKLSIRDKSFMAKTVILDPSLLEGIPKESLAYSAMDALVQSYESYISKNASWLTETYALKSIELINNNIIPAYTKPTIEHLSALLLGSYLGGIAFSHSRLGVIHGIVHPLGYLYKIPHGLLCSLCFIPSIQINKSVIGEKYDILSSVMKNDIIIRCQELLKTLHISSPLKGMAILEKEMIISETLSSGSTAANPKKITREDVEYILNYLFNV